jgi:hypothetical protein
LIHKDFTGNCFTSYNNSSSYSHFLIFFVCVCENRQTNT